MTNIHIHLASHPRASFFIIFFYSKIVALRFVLIIIIIFIRFLCERYCGLIDGKRVGLVASIERIVEFVFMQALAFPNAEMEDDDMGCSLIKSQLLPGLRSFCSALRVCEQVCQNKNVFDDGKSLFPKSGPPTEVQELSSNKEFCAELEERILNWIKDVAKVLMESEQLRKENDTSGPQDELEYWKKRAAQFSQLLSHLGDRETQSTIQCLNLANSKAMKEWRETDKKITFCYNEARDNSKFIQAIETSCHALYLDDPVNMKESILGLLQTVRLIYSVSQFYNTSERTSSLMVKVSGMIDVLFQCHFQRTIEILNLNASLDVSQT